MKSNFLIAFIVCLWLGLIAVGNSILLNYNNQADQTNNHPTTWPANSKITPSSKQPTLLMFIHPKCPCTRASLEELNRLLTNFPDSLNCHVVFFKADATEADWHRTDLWQKANKMKNLQVDLDEKGEEAKLFSVKSSGRVLLYDTNAHLLFSGGLTASRGHEGDNIGRTSIEYYLRTGQMKEDSAPSFGCALFKA